MQNLIAGAKVDKQETILESLLKTKSCLDDLCGRMSSLASRSGVLCTSPGEINPTPPTTNNLTGVSIELQRLSDRAHAIMAELDRIA
jgi:hypothetical protein